MTSTTTRRAAVPSAIDPVIALAERALGGSRGAISALRKTMPQSLAGLFVKARVAHVTKDQRLAMRVAWDMNMFARLCIRSIFVDVH
jgi:hypothetical protein